MHAYSRSSQRVPVEILFKVEAALIETLRLSGPPICELVAWLILVDIGTKTPAGKKTSWR
jgi:hypothetical protein